MRKEKKKLNRFQNTHFAKVPFKAAILVTPHDMHLNGERLKSLKLSMLCLNKIFHIRHTICKQQFHKKS